MRLIDNNKKYIIFSKVYDRIYIKEYNIRISNSLLTSSQIFNVRGKIGSHYLTDNIYDEIER